MPGPKPMQLTDLPFDMIEEIFFQLMQLCWSGIDFALCNRQTLQYLHLNRFRILAYLYNRPWYITNSVMHAEIENVRMSDYRSLHHGVKYLEIGRIKKLVLQCTSAKFGSDGVLLMSEQVPDWELESILGDWPSHKVVLVYDMN